MSLRYLTDEYPRVEFSRKDRPICNGQGADGYGRKIATNRMARFNGRMHRIYCCLFSNIGTCYVLHRGEWLIVRDHDVTA